MLPTSTQNYIEILEKTNQQLSLWYNPYGLMIGVLTLLVALLAIYFAYILWRQGKDYKDFLLEQKSLIKDDTRNYAKEVIDQLSASLVEELRTTTGEQRKLIERQLESLRTARESINLTEAQIQSILVLLQSFGSDSETISSIEGVLRGRQPFLRDQDFARANISQTQVNAIISLLQSFGADIPTIRNVLKVLTGPYRA